MLESSRAAVEHEQPRGIALGKGLLGDELGGKMEIEVGDQHGS
jgi:hypothetical protein